MDKNVLNTDLTGKVAVVTGAGGVLCSYFAKVLARAGAKVALLDLNEEAAKSLKIQRIQLPFDMELVGCVGFCSGDFLIRKHAQITKLDCFRGLYE